MKYDDYVKIVENHDLRSGQFLGCHDPRDKRSALIKLSHDNGIVYKTPTITKVYYDIETYSLNTPNEIP
jgi:hypothetical protein